MKTEVYSWRVSAELKTGLEREARRRQMSMAALLDAAAREWLQNRGDGNEGEEQQRRLHEAASRCLGAFAGGDAHRSENVRRAVRQRLRRRYER
jgi:hypothetical protein